MLGSIKYNLAHLLDFSGRDARQTFWFYVLFVFVLNVAVSMAVTIPAIGQAIGGAMTAARSGDQAAINAAMAHSMGGVMTSVVWTSAVLGVVNLLLLAAAFVRRLHDADFSGWWALLAGALHLFALALGITRIDEAEATMTAAMQQGMTASQLYATNSQMGIETLLGWLPILLFIGFGVLKSTEGPNRYADAPVRF